MQRLLLAMLFLLVVGAHALVAQEVLVEEYRFGDFTSAEALSVDQFGGIYIVDAGTSTVSKFDMRGSMQAEVGGTGWDNTQFDRPLGIDASLGLAVYVADMGNNRISHFDRGLRFMAGLDGEDGTVEPGFGYPLDVINSSFEQLYVLDGENNRVLTISGFNRVTNVFGDISSGEGRLTDPVAMGMGKDNRLYVLESMRVVVFDSFGNFLFHFGSGQVADAQGITVSRNTVLVVTTDALHFFKTDGSFLRTVTREKMVFASESGEFRDAAYTAPFLLLLTKRSCILFPNN